MKMKKYSIAIKADKKVIPIRLPVIQIDEDPTEKVREMIDMFGENLLEISIKVNKKKVGWFDQGGIPKSVNKKTD